MGLQDDNEASRRDGVWSDYHERAEDMRYLDTVSRKLETEMESYTNNVRTTDVDKLHALGITPEVGMVGVAYVRPVANPNTSLWEPTAEGEGARAYVTPVRRAGENMRDPESPNPALDARTAPIVDILAWSPDDPKAWGLREGTGSLLGHFPRLLADDRPYLEQMAIHKTPLAWMQHEGRGIVVLEKEPIARESIVRDLIATARLAHAATPRAELWHVIKELKAEIKPPQEVERETVQLKVSTNG